MRRTAPVGLALSILVVSVAAGFGGSAVQAISLSVETVGNGQLRLSWPANEGSHLLESTDALGGAWTTVDGAFEEANGQRQRSMVADPETRFFRLRRTESIPVTIKESSPASGETGVAVTRETILRLTDSLASDTVLGTNQVYAVASGRRLFRAWHSVRTAGR